MRDIGGVEATRIILDWNQGCRVVALTTFTTEWRALEVLRAGACGYLVKNSTPKQIIDAIVAAHAGDRVVSPEVQERFVRAAIEAGDSRSLEAPVLSERETQVIELIARGISNAEIAEELHYAEGTVKADIRRINQLWGVENRLQIVLRDGTRHHQPLKRAGSRRGARNVPDRERECLALAMSDRDRLGRILCGGPVEAQNAR